jgi:hypothetical protein
MKISDLKSRLIVLVAGRDRTRPSHRRLIGRASRVLNRGVAYKRGFAIGTDYNASSASVRTGEQSEIDRILRFGANGTDSEFLAGYRDGVAFGRLVERGRFNPHERSGGMYGTNSFRYRD